jgi:hypothetical protein
MGGVLVLKRALNNASAAPPVQVKEYQNRQTEVGADINMDLGNPYWSSNAGPMTFIASAMPPGWNMDANGVVTGAATEAGDTPGILITATNDEGSTPANLTFDVTVVEPPGQYEQATIQVELIAPPTPALLSNPEEVPTFEGALITCDATNATGTVYYYAKTDPFTGTEAAMAAEIMQNGIGMPASFKPQATITGQSPGTAYNLGWVQETPEQAISPVLVSGYTTLKAGIAAVVGGSFTTPPKYIAPFVDDQSVTDAKYAALTAYGFTGNVSDMYKAWLLGNILNFGQQVASQTISDMQLQLFRYLAGSELTYNDAWRTYLDLVAPGSVDRTLNDLEFWFWSTNEGDLIDLPNPPGDIFALGRHLDGEGWQITEVEDAEYLVVRSGATDMMLLWSAVIDLSYRDDTDLTVPLRRDIDKWRLDYGK